MSLKPIRIACKKSISTYAELDDLHILQGDLKELTKERCEAYAKEIEDTGYAFPIKVWEDINDGNKKKIIGGTQCKRVLTYMRDQKGFSIPPLPIIIVEADNLKQAYQRILQDINTYGEVSRQGLYEFMNTANFNIDEVAERFNLPIDMDSFKFEYFKDVEPVPGERKEDENPMEHDKETYLNNNIKQVVLFFESNKFEEVINRANALLEQTGLEDFSALFLKMMEYYEDNHAGVPASEHKSADEEDSASDGYDDADQ